MGPIIVQFLATAYISVLVFILSYANVWPSYAMKTLQGPDSPLGYSITVSDGSLIGSINMLGSVIAVMAVDYINEKFGRKKSVILAGLSFILAFSIVATAKSVTQLVIGRFLVGFGAGMQIVTALVFTSEISQPSIRGSLTTVITFIYNIGALVSYLVGWLCSYQVNNYLALTIVVAFEVFIFFMKETPPYLLRNGRDKEALKSLKFYRGTTSTTQEILDELVSLRSQLDSNDINETHGKDTKLEMEKLNPEKSNIEEPNITEQSAWKILYTSKSAQRAVILLSLHMILSVSIGMIGVQTYAGQFFRRAVPDISADLCSVILAMVFVLTSAVTILITDRIPRRVLMISSCLLSAVFLFLLASMLRWTWAPELCKPLMIVLFTISYLGGVINIPFVQISECLSPEVKSLGTTIAMLSMYLGNFAVLYLFEPVLVLVGLDGLFFLFGIMSVLTAIVTYLFMKETRFVPFKEVQEMFERGYLYHQRKT